MMSRKNTVSELSSSPMPMANTKQSSTTNGNRKNVAVGHTPENAITMSTATMENSRLTHANRHFSNGNMYLGIYTFFKSCEFSSTEPMAPLVASLKKVHNTLPTKKYRW